MTLGRQDRASECPVWSSWSYRATSFPSHISQSNMGDHQDDIQVIQYCHQTVTNLNIKSVQIAPSIEEGRGVTGSSDPSQSTSGRLKEEQKQTQPSSVLSPPKALPNQTKAKCSLGFCRANQVMMGALYRNIFNFGVGIAGI